MTAIAFVNVQAMASWLAGLKVVVTYRHTVLAVEVLLVLLQHIFPGMYLLMRPVRMARSRPFTMSIPHATRIRMQARIDG
jgi:hypothetical protein